MSRINITDIRKELSQTLKKVSSKGDRIVLHRRGKDVAALISMEDLTLLEALEDQLDAEEVKRRLEDPKEVPLSYEKARKELGLD